MKTRFGVLLLLVLFAGNAAAAVEGAGPGGFTTVHDLVIDAQRAAVWAAATGEVGSWWHPEHTVSGDAGRLRIDVRPQGCFCESLGGENAGVVHMSVSMVNPDVVLRLTGGLGPLGLMGVNGNMTWEFSDADDGRTRVRFTYAVGGYRDGGLDAIAVPVDYVIGEALLRLKAYVETGNAEDALVE